MADKQRFLDVWLVQPNTVYREVPFNVVCDWVQQGRLLAEDKLRWSGTPDWFAVGSASAFADYLPRAEPLRPQDEAEAQGPVELDIAWRRRAEDDDEDVDMIPLIDVSLVLLIFFMMTAPIVGAGNQILTPRVDVPSIEDRAKQIWIGIDLVGDRPPKQLVFSLGLDEKEPDKGDASIPTMDELLQRFDALLAAQPLAVTVSINAHEDVRSGLVRELTVELNQPERRPKIAKKVYAVREKK